jgi:phosphotransferase system enzyme I (PtsI)
MLGGALTLPISGIGDVVAHPGQPLERIEGLEVAPQEGSEVRGGLPTVPLGVMVETPAAALTVGALAEEADFFSIGTNDLVQYVLGVDRQSETIAELYQPFHPAVLRLLLHVSVTARARGRPTSVCGEMAADPLAAPLLVGMGFSALSVAPAAITAVRRSVAALRRSDARRLVDDLVDLRTAEEVLERLRRFVAEARSPRVRQDRRRR